MGEWLSSRRRRGSAVAALVVAAQTAGFGGGCGEIAKTEAVDAPGDAAAPQDVGLPPTDAQPERPDAASRRCSDLGEAPGTAVTLLDAARVRSFAVEPNCAGILIARDDGADHAAGVERCPYGGCTTPARVLDVAALLPAASDIGHSACTFTNSHVASLGIDGAGNRFAVTETLADCVNPALVTTVATVRSFSPDGRAGAIVGDARRLDTGALVRSGGGLFLETPTGVFPLRGGPSLVPPEAWLGKAWSGWSARNSEDFYSAGHNSSSATTSLCHTDVRSGVFDCALPAKPFLTMYQWLGRVSQIAAGAERMLLFSRDGTIASCSYAPKLCAVQSPIMNGGPVLYASTYAAHGRLYWLVQTGSREARIVYCEEQKCDPAVLGPPVSIFSRIMDDDADHIYVGDMSFGTYIVRIAK